MADPMIALRGLQEALDSGVELQVRDLNHDYKTWKRTFAHGETYNFAKIIDGEVQVLSIFGLEDSIGDTICFSIGFAVKESFRGRGLAIKAIDIGVAEIKSMLATSKTRQIFIEAVVDKTNYHSLNVAEKYFSNAGVSTRDYYTGTPALLFRMLITI